MRFNNAYLPLFFFCWALLYSPLAIWYVFEQNENLNTAVPKDTHTDKMDEAGDFECLPFTYTSCWLIMGHNHQGCNFSDSHIPFIFYKVDQCGAYRKN